MKKFIIDRELVSFPAVFFNKYATKYFANKSQICPKYEHQ